jgi:hypothetical protein
MHPFDVARNHVANAPPSLAAIEPVPQGRHVPGVMTRLPGIIAVVLGYPPMAA